MILDSTDSPSIARGTNDIGQVDYTHPRIEQHPQSTDWCYLFMHWAKVDSFISATSKHHRCFIHKTIHKYANSRNDVGEIKKPTISGLVFLQGGADELKQYLRKWYPDLHLAKNCANGQTAVIPDRVMQPFMKVAEHDPTRIRFLLHPLDYYANGRPRMRFTSGLFKGCEGYIVRIDRDRKLVMQIGDMTLAIGQIHKEQFENADDPQLSEKIRASLFSQERVQACFSDAVESPFPST